MLEEDKKFFQFLRKFRDNSLKSLPGESHESSRIQMELLVFLACNATEAKSVTVKSLLSSVPFSDSGVRKHFEALLNAGYIELEGDNRDRRVRYVKIADKLEKIYEEWAKSGRELLNDYCRDF